MRAYQILIETVANAGPFIAGSVLVFLVMVWMSSRRRGKRETDKLVLHTGQMLIIILSIAFFFDIYLRSR